MINALPTPVVSVPTTPAQMIRADPVKVTPVQLIKVWENVPVIAAQKIPAIPPVPMIRPEMPVAHRIPVRLTQVRAGVRETPAQLIQAIPVVRMTRQARWADVLQTPVRMTPAWVDAVLTNAV